MSELRTMTLPLTADLAGRSDYVVPHVCLNDPLVFNVGGPDWELSYEPAPLRLIRMVSKVWRDDDAGWVMKLFAGRCPECGQEFQSWVTNFDTGHYDG